MLKQDWQWLEIIKVPKIQSLPDILTPREVERLIGAARKLRYRVFILTTYSMGLRLGETLALEVGDNPEIYPPGSRLRCKLAFRKVSHHRQTLAS